MSIERGAGGYLVRNVVPAELRGRKANLVTGVSR